MSKKLICLLVATFMAISMSGCGSKDAAKGGSTPGSQSADASEENKEGSGELTEVTVSTVPWPTNMLFYLADEKGIYEKNGLKVTVQEFASTTESSNSFVGGKADFCTYASSETIAAFVSGADFSIVLETDKSNGCEGIVAKPEIKTPKDLKGKTIATQLYSVDHMLLLTLLDENGMSEKDINIVDMSIQESGNAFVAGQCDAASIWDPYFSKAKAAGGTELYSTRDNPDIITDVLAASGELCRENQRLLRL